MKWDFKHVEVLALILNNPRPCLLQVEPLEPIVIASWQHPVDSHLLLMW